MLQDTLEHFLIFLKLVLKNELWATIDVTLVVGKVEKTEFLANCVDDESVNAILFVGGEVFIDNDVVSLDLIWL